MKELKIASFTISVFFVILGVFLFIQMSFQGQSGLKGVGGELDISGIDFSGIKNVKIGGEWLYYPDVFLSPDEINSGGFTPETASFPLQKNGTYKLTLKKSENFEKVCLTIKNVFIKYSVYVNGKPVILPDAADFAADNLTGFSVGYLLPGYFYVFNDSDLMEIVINCESNSYVFSGFLEAPIVGTYAGALCEIILKTVADVFTGVCILVLGFVNVSFLRVKKEYLRAGILTAAALSFIARAVMNMLIIYGGFLNFGITNSAGISVGYLLIVKLSQCFSLFFIYFLIKYYKPDYKKAIIRTIFITVLLLIIISPESMFALVNLMISLSAAIVVIFIMAVSKTGVFRNKNSTENSLNFTIAIVIAACYMIECAQMLNGMTPIYAALGFLALCVIIFKSLLDEFKSNKSALDVSEQKLENEVHKRTSELTKLNTRLQDEVEIRKSVVEALKVTSTIDFLTGTFNKMEGQRYLDNYINQFYRYGTIFSVVMIDIDNFKKVNDKFGHDIGDIVLKTLSKVMMMIIRKSDLLARWGGEEFIVFMPNTSLEAAILAAEKIRAAVAASEFEEVGRMTLSLGASQIMPGDDSRTLVKRADTELYKAKRSGKNCVFPKL